jgi:hypothetical protein
VRTVGVGRIHQSCGVEMTEMMPDEARNRAIRITPGGAAGLGGCSSRHLLVE